MDVNRSPTRARGSIELRVTAMPENPEPSIKEILADPIIRALMTADGVQADELKALLRSVAKRLQAENSKDTEERTRRKREQ
jgi:hypothetical protein